MKSGIYKEIIICIVVIIFIVVLNIITESYTKYSVETTSKGLEELKEMINKEEKNKEEIEEKVSNIKLNWENNYKKLAYYVEHDELEKVNTELVSLKANIEVEEYEQGMPDLEKCIFILQHIKEKSAMQIKNVF